MSPSSPIGSQDSSDSDRGYFAGSKNRIALGLEAEDIEKYQQGLYFPVCIGDRIAGRYRIVHKLGHGAFSTVWLAHDPQIKKDVALKIMIPDDSAEHELHIQKEIVRTVKDVSGLILFTDTFLIRNYNDREHRVFVYPVLGPSINSFLAPSIPRSTRVRAAKQLLQSVKSLHDSGFIHGDLNGGNVMWGIVSLGDVDTATRYKHLGRPRKMALSLQKPAEIVTPAIFPKYLLTERIYLGDFGLITGGKIQGMEEWQPPAGYCAPEIRHNMKPSFSSDMWSYMCVLTQLYLDYEIFTGLSSVVNALGPMPNQWKNIIEDPLEFWYEQDVNYDFEERMGGIVGRMVPDADAIERGHVLSILMKGLRYLPEERPTAAELLQDPSFKALIEIHS